MTTAISAKPVGNAGAWALRIGAIWVWLCSLWAKIAEFLGVSADWVGSFILRTTSKIPVPAQVTEAFGSIFKTTEAVTSFVFTKVFFAVAIVLHKYLKVDITAQNFQYMIIGLTMIMLTYQFSRNRYNELLKAEDLRITAAAAAASSGDATKKRVGGAVIGAGLGLVLFLGNPLGAALGGLVGSMLSDTSDNEPAVEIKPVNKRALMLKAFGLGVLSSSIYTVLLILITLAPSLDPSFSLDLEGSNFTQSSQSAAPKSAIMSEIDSHNQSDF